MISLFGQGVGLYKAYIMSLVPGLGLRPLQLKSYAFRLRIRGLIYESSVPGLPKP